MSNSSSSEVDYYEKCELDDYALIILKALRDLHGRVASKNQLYEYIKSKYGGMPKKTFYKRLKMLEKCMLIKCSTSNPKLGIECEVTDVYVLKRAFENMPSYNRIIKEKLPQLSKEPLTAVLFLNDILHLLFLHILLNITLAITSESEERAKAWLIVTLEKIMRDLRAAYLSYSIVAKLKNREKARIANILNEWRHHLLREWLKLSAMDNQSKKEILKNEKKVYEQMKKEIKHLLAR